MDTWRFRGFGEVMDGGRYMRLTTPAPCGCLETVQITTDWEKGTATTRCTACGATANGHREYADSPDGPWTPAAEEG